MLTEDYFMRMINQVLAVLTQILYHREAGQYQEAQVLIDRSLEQLLGVRPELLNQMDDTSILRLLTTQGELDPDRLALVADLYKLEGDLLKDQDKNHKSILDYQRSLSFYLEISLSGRDQGLNELDYKIDEIYSEISGHKFPIEIRYLLFDYFEKRGDYVRAEEQISGLLRIEDQVYAVLPGIINYYESKLALSDRELSAGGVTRGEFIDRLAAVKNLLAEDN